MATDTLATECEETMTTELRWRASFAASCLYAADALRFSPSGAPPGQDAAPRETLFVNPVLAAALAEPVAQLVGELAECHLARDAIWSHLLPLSAGIDNNRELAELALAKVLGRAKAAPHRERLAGRIADLEAAFRRELPQVVEDLELRSGPIREQWEARGPGLLHGVGRLTDAGLLAEQAEVVLVQPVLGGGGRACPLYNLVLLEAVLTNPIQSLPEVVRLGWLLAQLNLELPQYQGELRRDRALALGALAMVPVVLAAAEDVELCRCDEATVGTALEAWRALPDDVGTLQGRGKKEVAAVLFNWWDTFAGSRPQWPVALAALDRMLG
jgi:hypothetical protein